MIKKALSLILLFLISICPLFSEEWIISTSQGDKTLIIPDGMTIEEAYQQMAVMYWEERYDREELQATMAELTTASEEYMKANEELRESQNILIQNYADLTTLYEEKTRVPAVRGLMSLDLGWDIIDNQLSGTLYGGVLIMDKVTVEAGLSYPWKAHLKAGIIF